MGFVAIPLQAKAGLMPLLELDGLTKRYGGIVAVDHVTMRVETGEVRAIIGPNGAGKTSLFHLISGVVKPTEGSVRFADRDISALPAYLRCQRGMSRTFQLTSLFPEMSARENVRLAGCHWGEATCSVMPPGEATRRSNGLN